MIPTVMTSDLFSLNLPILFHHILITRRERNVWKMRWRTSMLLLFRRRKHGFSLYNLRSFQYIRYDILKFLIDHISYYSFKDKKAMMEINVERLGLRLDRGLLQSHKHKKWQLQANIRNSVSPFVEPIRRALLDKPSLSSFSNLLPSWSSELSAFFPVGAASPLYRLFNIEFISSLWFKLFPASISTFPL